MPRTENAIGLHDKNGQADIGLVSAHVSGRLNGLVAQIQVRQVYKNWSDSNVECVYTFPLGWQSVLLGMHVELNGKRLSGTVKPKKMAERQYEQAIDSGDLPVMLERSGKDLYTANMGNIQTGDEVVVELVFAQLLQARDGSIRFNLPTTVAPRYGDAAASGMQPHQIAPADAQAEQRLFLTLDLSENLSGGTVHSPSHEIQQIRQGQACSIKLEGAAWLDRDFVLVVDRVGDMNFALASPDPTRPGEATVLSGGVFRAPQGPAFRPAAIKVLVDCSGSMQGDSMQQAQDCLGWLLGQLSSEDTVSFSRFGDGVRHEHPALQPCTLLYRQKLKASVRQLRADLGGTEIEGALQAVMAIEGDAEGGTEDASDAVILLITDGEVWNIDETIATVRASGQRIYAVGVGAAPAESLLKDMAEVSGGACEMVTPNESMQQAVERLLMRIRLAQKMAHQVRCSAPVLWQSKAVHHAADGESIAAWAQVKVPAGERASLRVEQTTRPGQAPLSCPVLWDPAIELSRISAALRLRDMPEAQEREALAMAYQLVSSETNLILVHERAEADKAEDLPELHQVRPMLAAGWGGNGSVRHSHSAVLASLARPSYSRIESFESMDSRLFDSIEPFQPSRSGLNTPAVWRTPRTHAASRAGNSSAGMDDIEIPAFLRRQADDDTPDAPKPPKGPIAKLVDKIMPAPQAAAPAAPVQAARPAVAHKTPKAAPDELMAVLQNQSGKNTQVQEFVESFNQAARTHARFRSALAVCLRSKQGNFLHWLVTKHMQSAGSAAPVWAVFIAWASDKFRIPLTPEADKALRDFMPTVPSEVQAAIRGDLEALVLKN